GHPGPGAHGLPAPGVRPPRPAERRALLHQRVCQDPGLARRALGRCGPRGDKKGDPGES
ncbi:unnamed protein product, partial [Heterosigma akashiwo]